MCIICDRNYDDNLIELNCYDCEYIQEIPILPNLKILICSYTCIKEIPNLHKLEYLDCFNTQIKEIPILPKLKYLTCSNTQIKEIPILPKLECLRYYKIYCDNEYKIKLYYIKQKLNRKLYNLYKLRKNLKTLWKIAEYYTKIKYHPKNINIKLYLN